MLIGGDDTDRLYGGTDNEKLFGDLGLPAFDGEYRPYGGPGRETLALIGPHASTPASTLRAYV